MMLQLFVVASLAAQPSPDVIDGERSVILNQVENGVAIRCAILFSLLGGNE